MFPVDLLLARVAVRPACMFATVDLLREVVDLSMCLEVGEGDRALMFSFVVSVKMVSSPLTWYGLLKFLVDCFGYWLTGIDLRPLPALCKFFAERTGVWSME